MDELYETTVTPEPVTIQHRYQPGDVLVNPSGDEWTITEIYAGGDDGHGYYRCADGDGMTTGLLVNRVDSTLLGWLGWRLKKPEPDRVTTITEPEPALGMATNRQLLDELQVRWSLGCTSPDYRTWDGMGDRKPDSFTVNR